MRAMLAILIAVTQIAGPWLCCCGPARIAAVFTPQSEPAAEAPAPTSLETPHCPLCAKTTHSEPARESAPKPKPTKPTTPERCPCGGVELLAVVQSPSLKAQAFDLELLVPVVIELSVLLPVEPLLPVDLTGVRELPFLTTAERLYTHHVLRC